jgi:hypothetical protein
MHTLRLMIRPTAVSKKAETVVLSLSDLMANLRGVLASSHGASLDEDAGVFCQLRLDAREQRNLAGDAAAQPKLERMRAALGRLTGGPPLPQRFSR